MLRNAAIVLFGFVAVFAILSGIGTSCVAWGAANYQPFASLAPYGWLFQLLVFVNILVGGVGVVATFALIRRKKSSYVTSLGLLVVFIVTAVIQMYYSSSLRGVSFFATPPTSIRLYITGAVLIYFLALRATPLWNAVGMTSTQGMAPSQRGVLGMFLLAAGITVVTSPIWAGPSHTIGGYNFAASFLLPFALSGGLLILGGVGVLVHPAFAFLGRPLHLRRKWVPNSNPQGNS